MRLSPREDQVVRALVSGGDAESAAKTLGLSVKTIATYRRRALKKLGVRTDVQLEQEAFRRGWVEPVRRYL